MKRWTKIAVIAVAAIVMTAAPAMAGHRVRVHRHGYGHRHGVGWSHAYHGYSYVPRVPVYHPPVYVPHHRHVHHQRWVTPHRVHSSSGIGIHTQGFGLHIRF